MFLEITVGQEGSKIYPLKNRLLVGSSEPSDIVVPVKGISRKHVLILKDNEEYFVVDQGSTNGTYVDEERIRPGLRVKIQAHLPVRLSGDVLICLTDDHGGKVEVFSEVKGATSSENTTIISLKEFRESNAIVKKTAQVKSRAQKSKPAKKTYNTADILNLVILILVGVIIFLAVKKS